MSLPRHAPDRNRPTIRPRRLRPRAENAQAARVGPRRVGSQVICLGLMLAVASSGCSGSAPTDPPLYAPDTPRAERIVILKRAISQERERIETLITQPPTTDADADADADAPLHQNPEVAKIAARLNAHERELARLEDLERTGRP